MSNSYEEKVKAQIEQFASANMRWKIPPVHSHWMRNYVWPNVKEVFECDTHIEFYANCVPQVDAAKVLSVGSGEGTLEISLAKKLIDRGYKTFQITLTELSEIRLNRARASVERAGLQAFFDYAVVDFNTEFPEGSFDMVLAHHTLHHIVELEYLFKRINTALTPEGSFATIDMIGRNGHMRWPETLKYVDAYWKFLPDRLKYNFQMNQFHEKFLNFDCSNSGFEGVRAQDILPLLTKTFWFEGFVGAGGITDILFERGYGQSFDMTSEKDVGLVDFLSMINDELILAGSIKPTMIFAKMRAAPVSGSDTRQIKHLSPEFCIRHVGDEDR